MRQDECPHSNLRSQMNSGSSGSSVSDTVTVDTNPFLHPLTTNRHI